MKQQHVGEKSLSRLDVLVLALKDLVEEHDELGAEEIANEVENTIHAWNMSDRETPLDKQSGVRRNIHRMIDVLFSFRR